MQNLKTLTLAIVSGSLLGWSSSAQALLIDDFDTPDSQGVAVSPNPPSSDSNQAAAIVLGGERDLLITRTGGNGSMDLNVNDTIAGALAFAEAFTTTGFGSVIWDGIDGSTSINTTGLGGIDLLADGADAFEVGLIGSDQPSMLSISVWSGSNLSQLSMSLPASGSSLLSFLFTDFVTTAGSGADFSNVGAIGLLIDGRPHDALDLAIDFVGTNGKTPVPEPSSLTLLGLGLAGLGRRLRQRRHDA